MSARPAPRPVDAIERRCCFAVWPQAFAHTSWFDALDGATGLAVSRRHGIGAGLAERAVADALLKQVGASIADRVADECVPWWAMQVDEAMHRHLSAVGALAILPTLRVVVGGAEVRHWDTVLGPRVRHVALLLGRMHPEAELTADAADLRRLGSAAGRTADTWSRFCLGLGLAALAEHGQPVRSRVRLAWPRALSDVDPLPMNAAEQAWLSTACRLPTQLLRHEPALEPIAA